jgi:hypothetical protein
VFGKYSKNQCSTSEEVQRLQLSGIVIFQHFCTNYTSEFNSPFPLPAGGVEGGVHGCTGGERGA